MEVDEGVEVVAVEIIDHLRMFFRDMHEAHVLPDHGAILSFDEGVVIRSPRP